MLEITINEEYIINTIEERLKRYDPEDDNEVTKKRVHEAIADITDNLYKEGIQEVMDKITYCINNYVKDNYDH